MTRTRRASRLLIVASAVVLAGACGEDAGPGGSSLPRGEIVVSTDGGDVVIDVEIAETSEAKQIGLMHRETLPEDSGMVFLEDEPSRISFTMRNTLIPLSLAVWDEDGRILSIIDMQPCEAEPCPSYDPGAAWAGALEVNQGLFEARGVEVGDVVRLER